MFAAIDLAVARRLAGSTLRLTTRGGDAFILINHTGRQRSRRSCDPSALAVTGLCLDVTEMRIGKHCKSLIHKYDKLVRIAHEPRGRGFKSCRARQTPGVRSEDRGNRPYLRHR